MDSRELTNKKKAFALILIKAAKVNPNGAPDFTDKDVLRFYWETFKNFDLKRFYDVLNSCLFKSNFFPSLNTITEAIGNLLIPVVRKDLGQKHDEICENQAEYIISAAEEGLEIKSARIRLRETQWDIMERLAGTWENFCIILKSENKQMLNDKLKKIALDLQKCYENDFICTPPMFSDPQINKLLLGTPEGMLRLGEGKDNA